MNVTATIAQRIEEHLLETNRLVLEQLDLAERSFGQQDATLLEQIRASDKKVNALSYNIEADIARLLTVQPPMAAELRYVLSAYKIAVVLERIGDIAKSITKHMVRLEIPLPEDVLPDLRALVAADKRMLQAALAAFAKRDTAAATEVWRSDDEPDQLCRRVFSLVIGEMQKAPLQAHQMIEFLFVAKNLERIADYATGIAKAVHYVASGEKPKKSILNGT